MYKVIISVSNLPPSQTFTTGGRVVGSVDLVLPHDFPVATNVNVSLRCLAEVKWTPSANVADDIAHNVEATVYHDRHYYLKHPAADGSNSATPEPNSDREYFLKEALPISDFTEKPNGDSKTVSIPFVFEIPQNANLPSSMVSDLGFIKYFIAVSIMSVDKVTLKKYSKEIMVQSPMRENLMISVGGSAEKTIASHGGNVVMHASIDRKGYCPGETISVHVAVNNGTTNAVVTPRVSLHRVAIFTGDTRHKSSDSAIAGAGTDWDKHKSAGIQVEPQAKLEQTLQLSIPESVTLSVKSSLITVKYLVRVILDVPDSFGLQIFLPIVITTQGVIGL